MSETLLFRCRRQTQHPSSGCGTDIDHAVSIYVYIGSVFLIFLARCHVRCQIDMQCVYSGSIRTSIDLRNISEA